MIGGLIFMGQENIKYGKPDGYKNINTSTMGKCGNRL